MLSSSSSKPRLLIWSIWFIASIFYSYQYILRVMPNILLEDIIQQFNINAATFGQFSGIYYIGYSLMHLPIGILLDRYGPRKIMSACILLNVIGLLPLLFADHWIYPIAGRFLIGLGSSAAILGVFKVIRMSFSEKNFPRMLSISVTIGLMGAIYGGGPVSYMRDSFGYEAVIQFFAAAGILLALFSYWIIPDLQEEPNGTVMAEVREVLSNSKVIFSCICAGLMVGPLEGFADVWGTAFLKQIYGYEGTVAASLPSMIFIGMCFGAPLLNFIAEKLGSYLATIISAGVIMGVSFTLLLAFPTTPALLTILFVLIGMCSAYQILAIYKASTYAPQKMAGLTTAMANMIIMIFGYAFHTSMGGVINAMGGPNNSEALLYGVSVIPIALFIGSCGFAGLLIKERKTAISPLSQ